MSVDFSKLKKLAEQIYGKNPTAEQIHETEKKLNSFYNDMPKIKSRVGKRKDSH